MLSLFVQLCTRSLQFPGKGPSHRVWPYFFSHAVFGGPARTPSQHFSFTIVFFLFLPGDLVLVREVDFFTLPASPLKLEELALKFYIVAVESL